MFIIDSFVLFRLVDLV